MNQAHIDLGRKAVTYSLILVAQGVAIAAAWCFSGWAFLLALILITIAARILASLVNFGIQVALSDDTFGSIGSALGGVTAKVTGLFSRAKQVATPVEAA